MKRNLLNFLLLSTIYLLLLLYLFTLNLKCFIENEQHKILLLKKDFFSVFGDFHDKTFELLNILEDDKIINDENKKKIFFVESHTNRDRKLEKPRQACSVESAARINPDMEVYFIFATNSSGIDMHFSDLIEALLSYKNIHLRFLNPKEFSVGTILEDLFQKDKIKNSSYPVAHLSDILRVLLLYKYGGQYLDLDTITFTPVSFIRKENFACAESKNIVANGILNLDLKSGFQISYSYAKNLAEHYNPTSWGGNGPSMLTNVIKSFCPNVDLDDKKSTRCGNFTVLPQNKCYPIMYGEWSKMYQEEHTEKMLEKVENSKPYFIHFWNKMGDFENRRFELPFTSKSAYMELAKFHCPKVYKTIKKYF
ncbi:hypothetical protein PVAND_014942 [Polypedilum vanderplanki]|uniref:Alpha 1,4-glycosyltransferase domain-containing protein n=1 Tax=Polypedilum vanderplanki TaxID=319348 RepID=A0A9J6BAN1_POLVA|nr:hypothetical protein PVAND_014942 [Polypedilum vanderplanki]